MLTLKDILYENEDIETIMIRCRSPWPAEEDMLFGYCSWKNGELISLDGDNYYLDAHIYKYEWNEDMLIVWDDEIEWT